MGQAAPASQPAPAENSGTATQLPEVVIRGRSENLVGVADTSNQGYVGQQELARRPILRPAEVLEAVPGLVITQHSGAGKANQYFLRGFQLDHGTDFAVSLEGVPQNLVSHAHGQGYLDLNYLIPELIQDINYRKGPYFADIGDFSAAGSADIEYVDSLPQGILSVMGGNYGNARLLVADSFDLKGGKMLYAFEGFHEDGPWKHADAYSRYNSVLKYSYGNDDHGWSITGLGQYGQWTATDQVAERAIDSGLIDRFGTLSPSDGGNTQRYTVVGEAHEKDKSGSSKLLAWGTYYDLDLFNDFTYFLDNPAQGDQFEQQDRRFYGGLRASHTFFGNAFGRTSDTTVGVQLRSDSIHNGLYNTQSRQRFNTVTQDFILESSLGVYVENRTQWLEKFRTEVSARGDFYNFHVRSDAIEANSGDENSAIFSPKLNLVFGPWYETEFYISGGYGFHSNDARGITSTVSPGSLIPAVGATPLVRAKGAEVGVRTAAIPHLQSTVSFWGLDLDSELVFEGDTAASVPGRPSRRYGVEFSNFYTPTDWLTLDADYSLSHAEYTDFDPVGDDIPESIQDVFEGGVTVHDLPGLRGWFGGMRLRYFGPRPLLEDDSVQSNSSTLINAELGYHFNDRLTVRADFLNLFDTKTDDIEYFYTSRLQGEPAGGVDGKHIHPAEPFEFRLTLTYNF